MGVDDDDLTWTIIGSAVALAAGTVAKKVVAGGWEKRRGGLPDDSAQTSIAEAVAFAVVSGVVVGVARLLAQRGAAKLYKARKTKTTAA